MTEIEWAEPPTSVADEVAVIADALRENPGRWALIRRATTDSGFATRIRYGQSKAWRPAGHFESRTVNIAANRYDVYARFVGPQDGVE